MSAADFDRIIAHVSFVTTTAPAVPTALRETRATITRNGTAVGRYIMTLTEAIADRDLEMVWSISTGETLLWRGVTVTRLTDLTYSIDTWASGDIGIPGFGSRFGVTPENNLVAGSAAVFETVGPLGGTVTSPTTARFLLANAGVYEVTWNMAFAAASEIGLFADPNTTVFALVPGSVAISGTAAAAIAAKNVNTFQFLVTAPSTLIELRNVGTADLAYLAAAGALDDEPGFSFTVKQLSDTLGADVITISDVLGSTVRLTAHKVDPG